MKRLANSACTAGHGSTAMPMPDITTIQRYAVTSVCTRIRTSADAMAPPLTDANNDAMWPTSVRVASSARIATDSPALTSVPVQRFIGIATPPARRLRWSRETCTHGRDHLLLLGGGEPRRARQRQHAMPERLAHRHGGRRRVAIRRLQMHRLPEW